MMRHLLFILVSLSLTGCGLTTRQAQNLADGLAGIEAVQSQVSDDPSASLILSGAHDHIESVAIEAKETLPAPLRSPVLIAADATGYAQDARQAIDDAHHAVPWWGWFAGIGASVLGILRFVPGAGGAIADTTWRLLAPSAHQEHDRLRDVRAQGFMELVNLIERLRPDQTIAHLKSKVTIQVSSPVREIIGGLVQGVPQIQSHDQTPIGGAG